MTQLLNLLLSGRIVAEQPLATASKELIETQRSGEPTPVPSMQTGKGVRLMFPATGLKGGLRRALLQCMRNALIQHTGNPKPFNIDTHYFLALGGVKGSGEASKSSVMHEELGRQKNPLMSVFGSGDAGFLGFVRGKLNVGNAIVADEYADIPAVHFSGSRTDDFFRSPEQAKYLTPYDLSQLSVQAEANRARSKFKSQIEAKQRELKKYRDRSSAEWIALDKEIKALEAASKKVVSDVDGYDNSVGMPLTGYLAIPSMVELDHKMRLMQATGVEFGALLAAIREFSSSPLVGGHHATGCGEISATWQVFSIGAATRVELGKVSFGMGYFEIEGEAIESALAEFDAMLANNSFDLSVPTEPEKPAKSAKSTVPAEE